MKNDDLLKNDNQSNDLMENILNEESEINNEPHKELTSGSLENNGKKKNKKVLIILAIVLAVIVLIIIAVFIYIKATFTAPKYLDEKIEEFTSSIDNMLSGYSLNMDEEYIMSGDFVLNTTASELASLNGSTINFNMGYSIPEEIVDLNFEFLKDSSSLTNLEAYIDGTKLYVNADDIYPQTLYMDLTDNPFADFNSEEYQALMNINNYKDFIVNFVKYLGIALKESDVNSVINGFTATYTYEINENNKEAFATKLNELIEQDVEMKEFLQVLFNSDSIIVNSENIPNMTLEIKVEIPSGDLKNFNLITDDVVINCSETEHNVYDVKIDGESIMEVTVDGDNVNLVSESEELTFNVLFNTKNYTLDGSIVANNSTINIMITNVDANTKGVKIDIDTLDDVYSTITNLVIDYEVTQLDGDKIEMDGTVTVMSNGLSIELEFNVNAEAGNDLISKKTFSNLKDINSLTTEDQTIITNNLYNILMQFGAGNM